MPVNKVKKYLKKTAARGVGILKAQAKKKAASNAKKAIGG